MGEPPQSATSRGQLSADGRWWWNGSAWVSAISPDGKWQWDGQGWRASPSTAVQASPRPAGAPARPWVIPAVVGGGIVAVLLMIAMVAGLLMQLGGGNAQGQGASNGSGAGPITGHIYWPDGRPAARIPVAFDALGGESNNCCVITMTDGSGAYQSGVCEGPHASDDFGGYAVTTKSGCLSLEGDLFVKDRPPAPLGGFTHDNPYCAIFLEPLGVDQSHDLEVGAAGGVINWRVFDGYCTTDFPWQSRSNSITAQDAQSRSPVPPSWQEVRQVLAQGG